MVSDISQILPVYFVSLGLQLIAWPWLFRYLKRLTDYGWSMGRWATLLAVGLLVWFTGHLKLPVNSNWGIALGLGLLVAITWWKLRKEIRPALAGILKIKGWVVVEEILFGIAFFGYALIRGYQPDILGLEKFMDYGFIKSYLTTPTLPASDMWWAGSAINYYSFGHFLASVLIRIWGVAPSKGYNLTLAFIMASALPIAFSVVANLLPEKIHSARRVAGGLVGALLINLGGNSHPLWFWLTKGGLNGYWYADATRFIHNTIHEFPGYSFVVSDLHGHVLSLPIVLIFVLLLIAWQKEGRRGLEIALGALLGVMAMTNTWDSAIYGLLLAMLFLTEYLAGKRRLREFILTGAIVALTAVMIALPWLIKFKSITNGLAAVTERSPLWQFLALWSVHAGVTLTALVMAARQKQKNLMVLALGLTAITLLFIPEFIYVRDIYPSHPRANTMFKLTYQAFIMMGFVFGWLFAIVMDLKNRRLGALATGALSLLFGGLMIFPFLAFNSYYGGFATYRGLDGYYFLNQRYPEELAMIRYLERNRDGRNLVEAVGDSYTETDFISAMSGVPTIVGWRVHEWLWRGGYDQVGRREEEVRRFYETKSDVERVEIIRKYNLGWVIITAREKQKYKLNEAKIKALGETINFGKTNYLVKIKD